VKIWECYSDMIQGLLDGMKDGLAVVPPASNRNRSHSYCLAYSDGYTSALEKRAKRRDPVAERLAMKADGAIDH
jgi:hypothetical protein